MGILMIVNYITIEFSFGDLKLLESHPKKIELPNK